MCAKREQHPLAVVQLVLAVDVQDKGESHLQELLQPLQRGAAGEHRSVDVEGRHVDGDVAH